MRLGEAITLGEAELERELTGDEIALVGRMVDAGSEPGEIMEMLKEHVERGEGKTYRYEARGDRVVEIE